MVELHQRNKMSQWRRISDLRRRIVIKKQFVSRITEISSEEFFTNAYGYPGERIQLSSGTYRITKLQVIRYAGLIASYVVEEGVTKKVNIGNMVWDEDQNCWTA